MNIDELAVSIIAGIYGVSATTRVCVFFSSFNYVTLF